MARDFQNAVVVITGASSGIGRAAAHAFAEQGAAVVLAARSHDALRAVAEECAERGGRPLPVPTDVTNETQVMQLAQRALDAYGRIDVWINDAAVTLFGRLEDLPAGTFEQVVETNLFGYVYGARAVLPIFRQRAHGVMVNVASVVAFVGQPFTSAYVASKWAVRGLSECLRMELMDEPDIHVCTVYLPSIDTPLFQHGANYSGRAVKPMEPVYSPEDAAAVILDVVRRPRREAFVGTAARLMATGHAVAPALMERVMARKVDRNHFQNRPAPPSPGNLSRPMWDATSGGWRQARSRAASLPGGALIAGAALAAAGAYVWRRSQQRSDEGIPDRPRHR